MWEYWMNDWFNNDVSYNKENDDLNIEDGEIVEIGKEDYKIT